VGRSAQQAQAAPGGWAQISVERRHRPALPEAMLSRRMPRSIFAKPSAIHPKTLRFVINLALAYLQSGQPGQVLNLIAEPTTGR